MDGTEITVVKVDKGTELAAKLLDFVEHFSWEELRAHTAKRIRDWEFRGWETPFAALAGERIVGMATISETDYYPLPELFPWISTVFVSEAYRGRRISERLIDCANQYARGLGFTRSYIPTSHVGLYEKYGYQYLRDIVNYGGGVDRLYGKELYRESLLWILDKTGADGKSRAPWNEADNRTRIDFVHSLGLKCDSVGWCRLERSREDSEVILTAIDRFCRTEGWTARGWYQRESPDEAAEWYCLRGREFRETEVPCVEETGLRLPKVKASAVSGKGPWQWGPYFCVSDRFRKGWAAGGFSGLRFCWLQDVGRCRGEQIFAISPERLIPDTAETRLACAAEIPGRLRESACYGRLQRLGGWLPRLAELFTELHVELPLCLRRRDLPASGLGCSYLPEEQSRILLRASLAGQLLEAGLLRRGDLEPLVLGDALPSGYVGRACGEPPFPDAAERAGRMEAYAALLAKDRPVPLIRERDALRLLRQAKRQRPGAFGKGMPKARREALTGTELEPLLPYYALCREAALSGEYALLDAEAVLAETEAFRAEMRKEELEPEGFPGLVIARCPDGDRVLLDPAGRVCRISHEAPEVCGEWSSLPRFIAEALEEDDLS